MHARVTLTRVIRQYCDVVIPNVESLTDADAQVAEALTDPLARARLLKTAAWYAGDDAPVESPSVAEIVESKIGVL